MLNDKKRKEEKEKAKKNGQGGKMLAITNGPASEPRSRRSMPGKPLAITQGNEQETKKKQPVEKIFAITQGEAEMAGASKKRNTSRSKRSSSHRQREQRSSKNLRESHNNDGQQKSEQGQKRTAVPNLPKPAKKTDKIQKENRNVKDLQKDCLELMSQEHKKSN